MKIRHCAAICAYSCGPISLSLVLFLAHSLWFSLDIFLGSLLPLCPAETAGPALAAARFVSPHIATHQSALMKPPGFKCKNVFRYMRRKKQRTKLASVLDRVAARFVGLYS